MQKQRLNTGFEQRCTQVHQERKSIHIFQKKKAFKQNLTGFSMDQHQRRWVQKKFEIDEWWLCSKGFKQSVPLEKNASLLRIFENTGTKQQPTNVKVWKWYYTDESDITSQFMNFERSFFNGIWWFWKSKRTGSFSQYSNSPNLCKNNC